MKNNYELGNEENEIIYKDELSSPQVKILLGIAISIIAAGVLTFIFICAGA